MVQMETPPLLRGTEQEQLAQLRSYLFQAAQHLNLALNDLSMDSFGKDVQEAIQAGGTQSAEKVQTSVDQTASALKDLIIKTANVIYQQMDVLETVLRSEYVAASDFGKIIKNNDKFSFIIVSAYCVLNINKAENIIAKSGRQPRKRTHRSRLAVVW